MKNRIQARRVAEVSFVIAVVAASCALPSYEVGDTQGTSTGSGATATGSGGKDVTSSSAGGTGGAGQGGQNNDGGQGGQGGIFSDTCPAPPKSGDPPIFCKKIGAFCFHRSAPQESCDRFKVECKVVATAESPQWVATLEEADANTCPDKCVAACPEKAIKGCFCDGELSKEPCVVANSCKPDETGTVELATCTEQWVWSDAAPAVCCNPKNPGGACEVAKCHTIDPANPEVGYCRP